MNLMKRLGAEFFGTFWLVLGGCGTAVLAGSSVGTLGISVAFGLTVLTMVYAVGGISGGHFNPAVSFGLWAGGRFSGKDLFPYIVAQVLGAILAAGAIYFMASGKAGFELKPGALASNGYGIHSPGQYQYLAALVAEVLMTFFFLFIILGATDKRAPKGFAGIAIGLALTLIH
jgi:aquaporin Z